MIRIKFLQISPGYRTILTKIKWIYKRCCVFSTWSTQVPRLDRQIPREAKKKISAKYLLSDGPQNAGTFGVREEEKVNQPPVKERTKRSCEEHTACFTQFSPPQKTKKKEPISWLDIVSQPYRIVFVPERHYPMLLEQNGEHLVSRWTPLNVRLGNLIINTLRNTIYSIWKTWMWNTSQGYW